MENSAGTATTTERPRAAQTVANPRRLRLGRDGRPLPLASHDDDGSRG